MTTRAIKNISGAVGHTSLEETIRILAQNDFSDADLAYLAMHYIDDYTIGNDWVVSAEEVDGKTVNAIDRRSEGSVTNPRYAKLYTEAMRRFGGETLATVECRVAHDAEDALAKRIRNHRGITIDPVRLPEYVDEIIRQKIEATPLIQKSETQVAE